MRLYILLVIILMKRMFPRHIWQVCSAPTPVLITAEITNIHFHLKCSNNESSFSSNLFIHFSSFSLSLISSTIILIAMTINFNLSLLSLFYLSPLQLLNTFSLSFSLSLSSSTPAPFFCFIPLAQTHINILYLFYQTFDHLNLYPIQKILYFGMVLVLQKTNQILFDSQIFLKIISVTYLIKHVNIKPKVYKIPGTYGLVWSFSF